MRKAFLLVIVCFLLAGCMEARSETAVVQSEQLVETSKTIDENKKSIQQPIEEDFIDKESDIYFHPKTAVDSPFGSDGNIQYQHTEIELEEAYQSDELIFFELHDQPVRKITNDETNMSIRNYGDVVIDVLAEEAYLLQDESLLKDLFQLISKAAEESDSEPIHFKTWEDMTNLERGMIQLYIFADQYMDELGQVIQEEQFEAEVFTTIQQELEALNSTSVLLPTPQTSSDELLFEQAVLLKSLWGQLGKFDHPAKYQDRYLNTYIETREEMQQLLQLLAVSLKQQTAEASGL